MNRLVASLKGALRSEDRPMTLKVDNMHDQESEKAPDRWYFVHSFGTLPCFPNAYSTSSIDRLYPSFFLLGSMHCMF